MRIGFCAPVDLHLLAEFSGQSKNGVAPGLGSTATTPMVCELLRRGHTVRLYTLSKGLQQEQVYRWGNLQVFVGPSRERHLARNLFRPEIAYLKRVIKQDAPPFVHAHWTYEFALGALGSRIPTLITIHDLPGKVFCHFKDPYRAVRLLMAYQVSLRGRHFTAVSEDAANHFRRYFRPGADIRVISNGLPDCIFEMGKDPVESRANPVTFATILQGWTRQKNGAAAIEAFQVARRNVPDARLIMFGMDYGPGGPAQKWSGQRGLAGAVTFVGPLPRQELLKRLSEEVDVVVHPSLDESFSLVAAESMALRKPVIAGGVTTGVREVLGYGEAGVLVDIRNPKCIADAIVKLAGDSEYRNSLAESGFHRASSLYRLKKVIAHYERSYLEISGEHQKSRTASIANAG